MAPRPFRWLSWSLLVYTVAAVVWGTLVRAVGAGAGCGSHWPLCNGQVLPSFTRYTTAIEFTHRAMTGLLTVWVLGWAFYAFRIDKKGGLLRKGAAWAVALVGLEGLIGAALVKLHLVENNASVERAVGVGVHLVSTFFLVGAIALTAAWASGQKRPSLKGQGRIGKALIGAVAAMVLLGVTGAINALGDTLFPVKSLAEGFAQDFNPNSSFLLHWRATHPLFALAVTAFLIGMASLSWFARPSARVRRRAIWLIGLVCCQVVAGLVNFALRAPVAMQMVHLALANTVWIAVVLWSSAALEEGVPTVVSLGAATELAQG